MNEKRILLVDDQPDIIEIITELLELDFEDAIIDTSDDPSEALIKIEANSYRIICTDYNMPVMNGAELIIKVRTGDGPNSKTPFIIITGDDHSVSSELKQYQDIEVVNKAENIPELIEMISKRLID